MPGRGREVLGRDTGQILGVPPSIISGVRGGMTDSERMDDCADARLGSGTATDATNARPWPGGPGPRYRADPRSAPQHPGIRGIHGSSDAMNAKVLQGVLRDPGQVAGLPAQAQRRNDNDDGATTTAQRRRRNDERRRAAQRRRRNDDGATTSGGGQRNDDGATTSGGGRRNDDGATTSGGGRRNDERRNDERQRAAQRRAAAGGATTSGATTSGATTSGGGRAAG